MEGYEKWVEQHRPDLCMVVGDVNSTVACRLVAAKEHLPVAHVEAGLRSFDCGMPEEVNRVITDAIIDLLFVTEQFRDRQPGQGRPFQRGHSSGWQCNDRQSRAHVTPCSRT